MTRTSAPGTCALLACLLATGSSSAAGIDEIISIRAKDTELTSLLSAVCMRAGLNFVLGPNVKGKKVSMNIRDMRLADALRYIAGLYQIGIVLTPDQKTVLVGDKDTIDGLDVGSAKVLHLSHADAEKYAQIVNKVFQGKVEAIADPRTNTVVVVPLKGR